MDKRVQLKIEGRPIKVIINGAHQKMLRRLRWDPDFIELQKTAINDEGNKFKYINQIRKKFNLSPVWDTYLNWYLYRPDMELPLTGGNVAEYEDEVTGKKFFIIPVEPETTLKNVKDSFTMIIKRYKEEGQKINARRIRRKDLAPIQLMAYRLSEQGLEDARIFKILEVHFPEEPIIKSEVSTLKRDGKKLALGQN